MSFPTILVDVAFGGAPGSDYLQFDDAVRGKFDTGTFAPEDVFTLVPDIRSFTTRRGRQRDLNEYAAGQASIEIDNQTGDYDPNNLSGPYVSGGVTQVKPMAPVRIRATAVGITYSIFRGFADSWQGVFRMPRDSIMNLTATDGFKALAAYEPGAASAEEGASEDTGARIARIASNAGWAATDRDLDTGDLTLQATTLEAPALTEIQGAVGSEQGYVFMENDGYLTFRNKFSRLEDTRSYTVQATFTNNPASNLRYTDIALAYDDDLIRNSVTGTIAGGDPQTEEDSASIADYLRRSFNGDNLWLETDLDASWWAKWNLRLYKDAELRVVSITVKPARHDDLWPIVLGAKFGDLWQIVHTPPAGDVITRNVFVEGIEHAVTASPRDWTTVIYFSSATVLTGLAGLIFDDATKGKLDTGTMV